MVRLSRSGFDFDHAELEDLKLEFNQYHTVKLQDFMSEELLSFVCERIAQKDFETQTHGNIALELTLGHNVGAHTLQLLMQHQALFSFIQELSGCDPIKSFQGRIYRMSPNAAHFDSWHDDRNGQRMVGISINLSPVPYEGGVFEIKHRDSDRIIRPMPNLGMGDAILFRLDDNLVHRIGPMKGRYDKTAFAGWFKNSPDFLELLKSPIHTSA